MPLTPIVLEVEPETGPETLLEVDPLTGLEMVPMAEAVLEIELVVLRAGQPDETHAAYWLESAALQVELMQALLKELLHASRSDVTLY